MKTIIVTTDFSSSAANALSYACAFAKDYDARILLAHIYSIPATYAGEGLSLATINDALNDDAQQLDTVLHSARQAYSDVTIESRMMVGGFLESLQALKSASGAAMIIMGAVGEYSDLWMWNDDWLNALITVSCPVLVVPPHITYAPVKNIAFACDYKKMCLPEHAEVINTMTLLSGARLHVVHVTSADAQQPPHKNSEAFKAHFSKLPLTYHTVEDKHVIRGLARFINEYNIDLLMVIPHQHGLWYSLFNKSYTKQLATLNHLPVMAIHDK